MNIFHLNPGYVVLMKGTLAQKPLIAPCNPDSLQLIQGRAVPVSSLALCTPRSSSSIQRVTQLRSKFCCLFPINFTLWFQMNLLWPKPSFSTIKTLLPSPCTGYHPSRINGRAPERRMQLDLLQPCQQRRSLPTSLPTFFPTSTSCTFSLLPPLLFLSPHQLILDFIRHLNFIYLNQKDSAKLAGK